MRLPTRYMRQSLTITRTTDDVDPLTGASSGVPVTETLLTQRCSLQQVRRNSDGSLPAESGVQADVPSFVCYTAWFPAVGGEGVAYSIDGTRYPLARRVDTAGQGELVELHLGQPQGDA